MIKSLLNFMHKKHYDYNKRKQREKRLKTDYDSIIRMQMDDIDDYRFYEDLYNKLHLEYMKKLQDSSFSINVERVRLENWIGKHITTVTNFLLYYFIALFSGIFVIFMQEVLKVTNKNNSTINVVIALFSLIVVIFMIGCVIDKDKPKDLISFISLQVLDDIEQEMISQLDKPVNKIQYNGCNWIGSKELPDFSKGKGNIVVDVGVWVKFVREVKRLIR